MMSALAHFEQYLNRRFSHSSTPIHYLSDLRIFIRSHGNEPPETITAADIDVFVDAQLKAGYEHLHGQPPPGQPPYLL